MEETHSVATSRDTSRLVAPHYDPQRHILSIPEVEAQLLAAGVPRTRRHVQRLCRNGSFDAARLGASDEWFIAPDCVPKVIGDLRALDEQRARRGATQRDASRHVVGEEEPKIDTDTSRHDATRRVMPGPQNQGVEGATLPDTSRRSGTESDAMSRYVALLERDNDFLRAQVEQKDEQITDLSKRFGETQTLLGAMQRMLAPLLGQSDPFVQPEKREVENAPSA